MSDSANTALMHRMYDSAMAPEVTSEVMSPDLVWDIAPGFPFRRGPPLCPAAADLRPVRPHVITRRRGQPGLVPDPGKYLSDRGPGDLVAGGGDEEVRPAGEPRAGLLVARVEDPGGRGVHRLVQRHPAAQHPGLPQPRRLRKRPRRNAQECSLTELSALSVKAGQPHTS